MKPFSLLQCESSNVETDSSCCDRGDVRYHDDRIGDLGRETHFDVTSLLASTSLPCDPQQDDDQHVDILGANETPFMEKCFFNLSGPRYQEGFKCCLP